MYYDKRPGLVYVISHSYMNGGERIEVFKVTSGKSVTLTYEKSLILPNSLMGVSNDLVVLRKGKAFFVTKFLPFADKRSGRDSSTFANYERWTKSVLGGYSELFYCKKETEISEKEESLKCDVYLAGGAEFNGMEYDEARGTLYVSDTLRN